MKIIFLIFLIYSTNLFSSDLVNWKAYKKDIKKPVFILLTNDLENKLDQKVFSDKRLAKLLNEKFYPIKVDVNENYDFKNRYLFMTAPSVAILNEKGVFIMKKRNYSSLTIESDLLNYLESLKNNSIRKMLSEKSREMMYKKFYTAYFLKTTKVLVDRSSELKAFMKKNIQEDTYYFNVRLLKPLYDYAYSVLKGDFSTASKLVAQAHVDLLLASKIFNKDYIYKSSIKNWSKPSREIIYKDNISFLKLLLTLNYKEESENIFAFLDKNYAKFTDVEKLLFKTVKLELKNSDSSKSDLKKLVSLNKNSRYLNVKTAVLKAYLELYKTDKTLKKEIINFADKLEDDFYNFEKGAFYDVRKSTEPFGFKFIPIVENIELAYTYTLLYKVTGDYNNVIVAKEILALMNETSIDNLIYSKYLLTISNLNSIK